MPLYESYPKHQLVIPEYTELNAYTLYDQFRSRRIISPGTEKDVTPMAMKLRRGHDFWGCSYNVLALEDEDQTGVIRISGNTSFSWSLSLHERRLVRIIGSFQKSLGAFPGGEMFIFATPCLEGAVVHKAIRWQPALRRSQVKC